MIVNAESVALERRRRQAHSARSRRQSFLSLASTLGLLVVGAAVIIVSTTSLADLAFLALTLAITGWAFWIVYEAPYPLRARRLLPHDAPPTRTGVRL